jgi:hypothetical protein
VTIRGLVVAAATAALLLTGCATGKDTPSDAPSAGPSAAGQAQALLAEHGLDGKSTVEIIDHLDRLSIGQRPDNLKASVRPHELVVSGGSQEYRLDIPDDRFYLSVAPYADRTHECFHHSLTTCKGELAAKTVGVRIVDDTFGKVLLDETRTTFDNGFVGFWLPRDIEGTLRITYDGKAGQRRIATSEEAPTCLTTLRLT